MLGTSGLVGDGSGGGGGGSAHEGNGGGGADVVVAGTSGSNNNNNSSSSMGDDEKGRPGDLFEGDRSTGGNRWPRQETLALLKIRSDMDVVFRDSSLKGPLWEEVSRKMAELGYHRSAKKCKEKFENVYKYHKRTKEGRVGKADGKTYRFFDQLEALEQHHSSAHFPPPSAQAPAQAAVPVTMVMPAGANQAPPAGPTVTVTSSPHPISVVHAAPISPPPPPPQHHHHRMNFANQIPTPIIQQQQQQQQSPVPVPVPMPMPAVQSSTPIQMEDHSTPPNSSPSATLSSSSSTSSDEELIGMRRKRKRKWKDFFEKLMREAIDKQEQLQKRFLEAVEKREHDRMAREEAWKLQEMTRLNREHEILVQERSMAAAKDAALISFLQKLSDQQQIPLQLPVQVQAQTRPQVRPVPPVQPQQVQFTQSQPPPQPPPQAQENPVGSMPPPAPSPQVQPLPQPQPLNQLPPAPAPQPPQQAMVVATTNNSTAIVELQKSSNGDNQNSGLLQASSSRWPKAEVQALINLRTSLDQKYQESGPKGPLWEEISSSMKKLGYNRNAKRCKEKWENINKYFKKVKESNKKRPEDSKTCPYFHQLDALYREKSNKLDSTPATTNSNSAAAAYGQQLKPENLGSMGPIMAQKEQQWPVSDHGSDQNHDDSEDDEGDEEDDDDQGNGFEIVANNAAAGSMSAVTTTTTATTATAV